MFTFVNVFEISAGLLRNEAKSGWIYSDEGWISRSAVCFWVNNFVKLENNFGVFWYDGADRLLTMGLGGPLNEGALKAQKA